MIEYVNYVLRRTKKSIDLEQIFDRISYLKKKEEPYYAMTEEERKEIRSILQKGVSELEYYEFDNGSYALLSRTHFRKGRLQINKAGEAFVHTSYSYLDGNGNEVVKNEIYPVAMSDCCGAIDGDFVLIEVNVPGQKPRVERIIDRTIGNVFGEIIRLGNHFFIKPLDPKQRNLTIALEGDYIEGTFVLASLEEVNFSFYKGKVLQEYRHKDDPHAGSLEEAIKSGMPIGFSEDSIKQLDSVPTEVFEKDEEGRYDFSEWEIFSIDGVDTKDKDDCISLKVLPNGNYLLGVHIADVPYYVPTNSPLHKDAIRKGTSYYFGGSVEPQLPRKLSNGICSLNDGVKRLTKSVLIEYDKSGNVINHSLVKGVIQSRIGMNYDKVNDILRDGIVDLEYAPYEKTLLHMAKLALALRKKRKSLGAISFNRPENKFQYDENGDAIEVGLRHQDLSEHLIEEFMLAANHNVGEIMADAGLPVVYRVHGNPNREKLGELLNFLECIHIPFDYYAEDICKSKSLMQTLAQHIKDKGGQLQNLLSTKLICCMAHASYSSENIGHYGTGFDVYIHFTSPIRRLADDTISRILDDCYFETDENKRKHAIKRWKAVSEVYALQASKMERVAEEVEKNVFFRDSVIYFSNHLEEEFEGTIISVGKGGLSIQLDNLLEGRIPTFSLPGGVGNYVYNPKTFTLLSLDNHDSYYMGDCLKVRVKSTDIENKTVQFSILEKVRENPISDIAESNEQLKNKKLVKRNNQ